jgi:hypothetical protein
VRIAVPRIHSHTVGFDAESMHGLAESAIGHTIASANFDDRGGTQEIYQIHSEGNMLYPRGKNPPPGLQIANRIFGRIWFQHTPSVLRGIGRHLVSVPHS